MHCCEQVKNKYGHIIAQKKYSYNYSVQKRMKKKRAGADNKLTRVIAIAVVSVVMVIVIIAAFIINFNKIYGLLLEKDMEQVRFTSCFVTKLISTEIENLQAALDLKKLDYLILPGTVLIIPERGNVYMMLKCSSQ